MESKRKNVYIVLFVITTIIAGCLAVYFGIMRNKDVRRLEAKIDELVKENDENKVDIVEENVKKELLENKEDKIECNKTLKENVVIISYIIGFKGNFDNSQQYKFNSGKFNDKEKLSISLYVAIENDLENYENNVVRTDDEPVGYVKMKYLNDWAQKIFGEDINFNNIENKKDVDTIDCNSFYIGGLGVVYYKAKSLIFDESTQEYILTFDKILYSETNNIIENYETVDYDSSLVDSTYALKYKKSDGNYILISLDLIS